MGFGVCCLHTVDIHPVRAGGCVLPSRSFDTAVLVEDKSAFCQLFATHYPRPSLTHPVVAFAK